MSPRTWVLLVALAGCHHDPAPVAPVASSEPRTPIGYLLADAGELHLNDDQLTMLRGLDATLAAQLAIIDPQLAAALKAQGDGDQASATPSGGGGGSHGGMGGGGMGGGGMGGGGRRGRGRPTSNNPPPSTHKQDTLDRLIAQRATEVRDALTRALATFDPTQQKLAKVQLENHDIDLDADAADEHDAAPAPAPAPVDSAHE